MTKNELLAIPGINASIRGQKRLLAKLKEESTCLPNFSAEDKVQVSPRDTSMAICRQIVDVEREIAEDEENLNKLKKAAENLILGATGLSGVDRNLMRLRYLDCESWQKIADHLGYTYRHTTRLHGRILNVIFGSN